MGKNEQKEKYVYDFENKEKIWKHAANERAATATEIAQGKIDIAYSTWYTEDIEV